MSEKLGVNLPSYMGLHNSLTGNSTKLGFDSLSNRGINSIVSKSNRFNVPNWTTGIFPHGSAKLDLDFIVQQGYVQGYGLGGCMDHITFSRASSGTYFGSDGLMVISQNLFTYSNDFSKWTFSSASATTNSITLGTGYGTYCYKQISGALSGQTYTGSITLSGVPGTQCYLAISEDTGTFPITKLLITLTTTPTRYSVTRTLTQSGGVIDLRVADNNQAIVVTASNAQLELGASATSYSNPTGPRFDYDSSTPAGTTGVELTPSGSFTLNALSLGSSDGAFSTLGGNTTIVRNTTDAFYTQNSPTLVLGKTYKVTVTVVSGSARCGFGDSGLSLVQQQSTLSVGSNTIYVNLTSATYTRFSIWPFSTSSTIVVSNISVQEVVFPSKGLLIEESRTNLCLQSQNLTTTPWSVNGAPSPIAAISPDGGTNACLLYTSDAADE